MMEILPENDPSSPMNNWLDDSDDVYEQSAKSGCFSDREKIKEQLPYVIEVAKTFNDQLLQADQVNTVQYYLRVYADRCFDLLALVPQNKFFNEEILSRMKSLKQHMKAGCRLKGYRVGIIIGPWIKDIESLHLCEEGYVLIYNAA